MRKLIFIFTLIFLSANTAAQDGKLSVELQNTNLPDAIRFIAKLLDMNVIISPAVHGMAVMNLHDAAPEDALNMLLISHSLAKSRVGKLWFIAPQEELFKRKQEELKWQELNEEAAPLTSEILQMKYAKANEIAKLLQDSYLSKRGRVRVDARTNIICIQDTEERLLRIRHFIDRLDVSVKQISITARLVSIDSDYERDLGLQFQVKGEAVDAQNGHYSLALAKLADGSLLDVKLAALENAGHAELISSPGLFTANQQLASIEAGEEVPYQEVSESGGTAVVFKKAVLGLKVIPQVLPGKNIQLRLQINQDRPNAKMVQGMPSISTRQIISNVLVKSGQTIVLGGIYEMNTENGESGLPFVNRIPILCWLFRQQNMHHHKRELLIFVTPRIID
jgi:type IV pilus assembly protein PilQ